MISDIIYIEFQTEKEENMRTLSLSIALAVITSFMLACPQSWAVWTGSCAYHTAEAALSNTDAQWSDDSTARTLDGYNTWQSIASRVNSVGWHTGIVKPGAVLAFDSYR